MSHGRAGRESTTLTSRIGGIASARLPPRSRTPLGQPSRKDKRVLRSTRSITTVVAALAATALLTGQAMATTATDNASGTFYFTDLLGGNQQVVDPELNSCKLVSTLGTSVSNQTDATVVLYTDTSCALLANPVSPGSSITFVFKSYRFIDN
jgi:hypothetical protein